MSVSAMSAVTEDTRADIVATTGVTGGVATDCTPGTDGTTAITLTPTGIRFIAQGSSAGGPGNPLREHKNSHIRPGLRTDFSFPGSRQPPEAGVPKGPQRTQSAGGGGPKGDAQTLDNPLESPPGGAQ